MMMKIDTSSNYHQEQQDQQLGINMNLRHRHIRFSPKVVTSTQVVEHWSQYSEEEWNAMYMNKEDEDRMEEHWKAWLYSGEKEKEKARQELMKQRTQRELRAQRRRRHH